MTTNQARSRGQRVSAKVERRSIAPRDPIVLSLPFPISINHMFGNAPGRKRFPMADYATWKDLATVALRKQKPGRMMGPITISLTYEDRGRCDIDNLAKGVIDLLVREQVIEADGRSVLRAVYAKWGEANGVRVEIHQVREGAP